MFWESYQPNSCKGDHRTWPVYAADEIEVPGSKRSPQPEDLAITKDVLTCNSHSFNGLERQIAAMQFLVDRLEIFEQDKSGITNISRNFERFIELGNPLADTMSQEYAGVANSETMRDMINYMLLGTETEFFANNSENIKPIEWKNEFLLACSAWKLRDPRKKLSRDN